jgi:hypothetical protein
MGGITNGDPHACPKARQKNMVVNHRLKIFMLALLPF